MIRTIIALFFVGIGQFLIAQPLQLLQLRSDGIAQWEYMSGDEFNDGKLNKKDWRSDYPWGRNLGNKMLQYYSDDNIYFKDGIVVMEARRQDTIAKGIPWMAEDKVLDDGVTVNKRKFEYTSGMLFSKEQYFQGYFESRLKTSKGQGFFPAFWLYGANPNEEIDIIEAKGERPNSYHVDMHCPDGCSDYKKFLFFKTGSYGDWIDTESDLTDEFHTYAGEWIPGEIVFYLDDIARDQWAGNLKHPANVIFNFGVSGREGGGSFDGGIDETTPFPQTFEVDYVRMYKRIDEGWEEKEKAKLNRKGRKKKRRKKRVEQRVKASARVFYAEMQLLIETTGENKDEFQFRLMNDKGEELAKLSSESDTISYDCRGLNSDSIWLVSTADGFTRKTKLEN